MPALLPKPDDHPCLSPEASDDAREAGADVPGTAQPDAEPRLKGLGEALTDCISFLVGARLGTTLCNIRII